MFGNDLPALNVDSNRFDSEQLVYKPLIDQMKNSFCRFLCQFAREEEAATTVEYSVMLALIVVACLATIQTVGSNASGVWNDIATDLDNVRAN